MKPYHFLNMFLTFRHLKPYVLIWFVLIKTLYVIAVYRGWGFRGKSLQWSKIASKHEFLATDR